MLSRLLGPALTRAQHLRFSRKVLSFPPKICIVNLPNAESCCARACEQKMCDIIAYSANSRSWPSSAMLSCAMLRTLLFALSLRPDTHI